MSIYYKIEIHPYSGEEGQYYWSVMRVISPGNWSNEASGFADTPEDAAHAAKEWYDKCEEATRRRRRYGNT